VAYQYGISTDDFSDLLQEVRIALWLAGSDVLVNPAWIIQTATHKAVDLLRRLPHDRESASDCTLASKAAKGVDPELIHLLRARVDLMPDKLRSFYQLRFREGLSEREISQRLGICRASVRNLERRCLAMIGYTAPREVEH
jgi:RNA polymerase sigma factor (sigma-70 family)